MTIYKMVASFNREAVLSSFVLTGILPSALGGHAQRNAGVVLSGQWFKDSRRE
jgi:hypothetical protein